MWHCRPSVLLANDDKNNLAGAIRVQWGWDWAFSKISWTLMMPLITSLNLWGCTSGGLYVPYIYLIFTFMPGESYHRRLRSLLYLCYVFWMLINSLVCWHLHWFGWQGNFKEIEELKLYFPVWNVNQLSGYDIDSTKQIFREIPFFMSLFQGQIHPKYIYRERESA